MKIKEDHGHAPTVDMGRIEVEHLDVRARINAALEAALGPSCVTPYVGLERIRRVLTRWSIFIPGVAFLEGNDGSHDFEVSQFGIKIGAHENGKIITKDDVEYEIKFSWHLADGGAYSCSASIKKVGETTN